MIVLIMLACIAGILTALTDNYYAAFLNIIILILLHTIHLKDQHIEILMSLLKDKS